MRTGRAGGVLVAALCLQVLSFGLFWGGRAASDSRRRHAAEQLRARETDLQQRWTDLLGQMERASEVPPSVLDRVSAGSVDEAFSGIAAWAREHPLLDSPAAVAVFDAAGRPLAWTGSLQSLDPPSSHSFAIERIGTTLLLVHRHFVDVAGTAQDAISRVELLLSRGSDAPSAGITDALGFSPADRPGDLLLSEDPGPSPASLKATLEATGAGSELVPLPDPGGDVLAVARLDPGRPESASRPFRILGWLLTTLAFGCLALALLAFLQSALASPPTAPMGRTVVLTALLIGSLAGVRLALSGALHEPGPTGPLAGPALFSQAAPFGLLASPLDLLLTALLALAASAALVAPLRLRLEGAMGPGARPGNASTPAAERRVVLPATGLRAVAALAGAAILAGAALFAYRLPYLARINPVRFRLLEPELPRLALQAGALALAAAGAVLLLAAAHGLGPFRLRPLRRSRLSVPLTAAIAALAAGGALAAGSVRAQRMLISERMAAEFVPFTQRRDRILEEVLERAAARSWDELAASPEPGEQPTPALAFAAWSGTELALDGLKAAVAILDAGGRLRSEFTCNLPPGTYRSLPAGPADAPALIQSDSYSLLTLRIGLLRGETPLRLEGRVVGRLVVQLSTEPDNLPLFTRNDPLPASLLPGGNDPVYDEFLGGDPVLVIYSGATGEVLYSSALRPPPLSPTLRERLSSGNQWRDVDVGGTPCRMYFFPAASGIVGLGAPTTGSSETASQLIRFLLLGLACALLLAGVAALVTAPRRSLRAVTIGWIETLRTSWPRRLLAVLLLATVLPLVGLSAWVRAQVRERMQEGIETAGLTSLETARRLLEDYLEATAAAERPDDAAAPAGSEPAASSLPSTPSEPATPPPLPPNGPTAPRPLPGSRIPITDDALFWLSRVVRQDLSVFVGGQLVAASRPDLYETGVLPRCLDGAVARQIIHRRDPYTFRQLRMGRDRTLFIYAPVALPGPGGAGVLGLPLAASQRQQRHEADVLGEGLLSAAALLGGLLSLVAVITSRRISGPVRQLTRATARVAEGDYAVRLPVATRDEPGQLMDAFNTMAAALEGQRADLRRRADYIEKILLNATTGVVSVGPGGTVRTINPAARLLLGIDADPTGRKLESVLATNARLAPIERLLRESLASAAPKIEREVELEAGEAPRRLRCVLLPLREREEGPAGRIVLIEDLTDIVRSNRLAAWAEMARGIAHEIKNPLTPIQLSAEHLLRMRRVPDPAFDPVLDECLKTILAQVRELREIAAEFSSYARLPALQRRPIAAAELVRDTLAPYRATPPPRITIEERHEPARGLSADPRVLRRCLVNLVENALQAMPDGGTLSARTGPGEGDTVVIEVADTGEGMDEATLQRVFEPYFSTREAGTGLGLAIARRAVEEHGGTLTAHSRPGRGTTMTIRLPAIPAAADSAGP